MKYIKLVFEYLFKFGKGKRFLITTLIALPFSVLLAFAVPSDAYFGWFINHTGQYKTFGDLISSQFAGFNVYFFLGAIAVSILTIASITGMMNFCLRTGKFRIGNLYRGINDNFFSALKVALFFFVGIFLTSLILMFFLYPIGLITIPWLVTTLSIVLFVLYGLLIAVFLINILLFLPIMTYNGTGFLSTMKMSLEKTQQADFKKLYLAVLFPIFIVFVLGFIGGIVNVRAVGIVLSTIACAFATVYLVTLSMLVYFDVEGLQREDTPKEYLYQKYENER